MMLASILKGLVVSISLMNSSQAPSLAMAAPGIEKAADQFAALPPEVRLRKLHLVRPDLIPFPIAYEVYC